MIETIVATGGFSMVIIPVLHLWKASMCCHLFSTDSNPLGLQPIDFIPAAPQRLTDERNDREISVVIAASDERLGGAIAAMNSIYRNTRSNVVFYIVTLNDTVDHLR